MASMTTYELDDGVATIVMDDGKVNALSPEMLDDVNGRFDQAQADDAIVLLTGRPRTFSARFDLRVEAERWAEMLTAGARTAERMLSSPRPVIVACTGNAVAMGAFLLLAADYRIGVGGDFRVGLNEVAIGLTLPWFGIALARHRLTRPAFDMCCVTGVLLDPEAARGAGFLDRVVEGEELMTAAREVARQLGGVDAVAHAATKVRIRERALAELRDGIAALSDPERQP